MSGESLRFLVAMRGADALTESLFSVRDIGEFEYTRANEVEFGLVETAQRQEWQLLVNEIVQASATHLVANEQVKGTRAEVP